MIELLAFVVAAVIVAAFWRLFAGIAVAAAIGAVVLVAVVQILDAGGRPPQAQTEREAKLQQFLSPAPQASYELYRDDSRTAYPAQVWVGTYQSLGACQRTGEKLSYLADRVEVHYCLEASR